MHPNYAIIGAVERLTLLLFGNETMKTLIKTELERITGQSIVVDENFAITACDAIGVYQFSTILQNDEKAVKLAAIGLSKIKPTTDRTIDQIILRAVIAGLAESFRI